MAKKKEKLLIVVDMQNDFIDGVFGTEEAKQIVEPIATLMRGWQGKVLLTKDTHLESDWEGKPSSIETARLPQHCVFGTEGWQFNKFIRAAKFGDNVIGHICKATFGYMGYNDKNDFIVDAHIKTQVSEIYLCGLCTDICILHNAIILRNMFPKMPIHVYGDLCAGTTPEKHSMALEIMRGSMIDII